MPCHRDVRCQADQRSSQVCHLSRSVSEGVWQPALHQEASHSAGGWEAPQQTRQKKERWRAQGGGEENQITSKLLGGTKINPVSWEEGASAGVYWQRGASVQQILPATLGTWRLGPNTERFLTSCDLMQQWLKAVRPESLLDVLFAPWYEIPTLDKLALPRSMWHLG